MLDALAAFAQTLLYGGVLLAAGAVFASATLQPSADLTSFLQQLVRKGAWLTIGASLLAAAALVLRLGDAVDAEILSAVFMSNVGAAIGLRFAGCVLLLVTPIDEADAFARGMQISAAVLVLASFLFSGHAAAEGIGLGVVAALHVGLAGWWLSALVAMRRAGARDSSTAVSLVRRFSALAILAVGALILAGGLLIAVLVEFSPFELTTYVRNLAIKLAVVAAVLALASYNKFVLTARVLANDAGALLKLRRAIDAELVLVVCVLIATAIMTTYSSPHE